MSHFYSIHTKNREIAVAVSEILSSACVNIPNLDVSISHVFQVNNDNLPISMVKISSSKDPINLPIFDMISSNDDPNSQLDDLYKH